MKIKFFLFYLLIMVFVVQVFAQVKPKIFRGTLDGKNVQLTLIRDGEKLSGTYFYSSIKKDLRLNGTINSEGDFKLDEFAPNGEKTGEFTGKWSESLDENGISLEGNWINPKTKQSSEFYVSEQMIYFSGNTNITSKFINEKYKPKLFEITAEYPVLTGENSGVADKFNAYVNDVVTKEIKQFRSDMMAMTAEDLKFTKQNGMNNYLEIGYNVEFANDNVVSISFDESTFAGGAHPNHNSFTINYDLKNNKELKLADLFKPNSNYLKVISSYSIQKLKVKLEDMRDDEQINEGAGAAAKNFTSWNITSKGILINFDPYQVAAYAAGPQEVLMPYSELKNILRENALKFIGS